MSSENEDPRVKKRKPLSNTGEAPSTPLRRTRSRTSPPVPVTPNDSLATPPGLIRASSSNGSHSDPLSQRSGVALAAIDLPKRFSISQSICSYGYFGLAPNTWRPAAADVHEDRGIFIRPLSFGGDRHGEEFAALVRFEQTPPDSPCSSAGKLTLTIVGGDAPQTECHREQIVEQARRILRLDWDPDEFWNLHPEARRRGFGRTYRSPTLWEDMVKTLTNCNMKWSGTVQMNLQMCSELGRRLSVDGEDGNVVVAAFPTARQVHDAGPAFLKERCRLGYRASWVAELATKFLSGEIDSLKLEDGEITSDTVFKALKDLKGFGPFASANVMQLMGRFDVCPYDTETTRLFREEFGVGKRVTTAKVHQQARDHYDKYAPYRFLAYWFDLWRNYEQSRGEVSTRWSREACSSL